MKKKLTSVIFLIFLANILLSQEIPTLKKLYEISVKLGVTFMVTTDTMPTSAYQADFNILLNERETYLLKAAEFDTLKDYVTSNLYITKARTNFRNKDFVNLSFVLLIGSYSNLKEIALSAKFFYIAARKKQLYPENIELIGAGIKNNFSRHDFDDALSTYFYYHDRQAILQSIYNNSQN
jgi:hypothetical protein